MIFPDTVDVENLMYQIATTLINVINYSAAYTATHPNESIAITVLTVVIAMAMFAHAKATANADLV